MGTSSPSDTFNGGTQPVKSTDSRLRSAYGVLIDDPAAATALELTLAASSSVSRRGQIPATAIIRIGNQVVYSQREIEKYAAKLAAIEEAKHELERTLTPKKAMKVSR